jgi:hypothetical protein
MNTPPGKYLKDRPSPSSMLSYRTNFKQHTLTQHTLQI